MRNPMSILVPVDFSPNAATAYRYALNLVAYLDASIKLIHVNTDLIASSRPLSMVKYPSVKAALEKKLEDFMEKENSLQKNGLTTTSTHLEVIEGITVSGEIIRRSKEHDLIVVGAKGENLTSKKLFGSIPTLLAQKAHSPVLVIPMEAEFYKPTKILFASNWESSKEQVVRKFVDWASLFQVQANFLHISSDYAIDEFEKIKEDIFDILEEYDDLGFSYLIADKKSVSPFAGILEYANEEEMDWIAVANRQRGFINNILGLSMSKELTTNPRYPVLIVKSE